MKAGVVQPHPLMACITTRSLSPSFRKTNVCCISVSLDLETLPKSYSLSSNTMYAFLMGAFRSESGTTILLSCAKAGQQNTKAIIATLNIANNPFLLPSIEGIILIQLDIFRGAGNLNVANIGISHTIWSL